MAFAAFALVLAACSDESFPGEPLTIDDRGVLEGATMHFGATATALPDGRVLVTGGGRTQTARRGFRDAELIDLDRMTVAPAGVMSVYRAFHTATLLDDGQVLVAGEHSADLWSPDERRFHPVAGDLQTTFGHSAARLADGTVLISGGLLEPVDRQPQVAITGAFLFDPATETFRTTGSMPRSRVGHTTIALPDGDALVIGDGTIDRYDRSSGRFERLDVRVPRSAAATLLRDGRVLIVGGVAEGATEVGASILVLDPATGALADFGALQDARLAARTLLLGDGRVLIVGGADDSGEDWAPVTSVEVIDPATGGVTTLPPLDFSEHPQTLLLLEDGRVLVLGSGREGDPAGEVYEVEHAP